MKTKKRGRLTFKQICISLGITPRQRVKLVKYYKQQMKGGVDNRVYKTNTRQK